MSTLSLQNVKQVRFTHATAINEKTTREIEITLDNGSTFVIELWTTNDELKLEIL
jgi:hypothetical protein